MEQKIRIKSDMKIKAPTTQINVKTQLFLSGLAFRPHWNDVFEHRKPNFPEWINLKTNWSGRAKTELFENADKTTVMCACARMLYHAIKLVWSRGSILMWTENTLSMFATGIVWTENILCVFKFIRITVDGAKVWAGKENSPAGLLVSSLYNFSSK